MHDYGLTVFTYSYCLKWDNIILIVWFDYENLQHINVSETAIVPFLHTSKIHWMLNVNSFIYIYICMYIKEAFQKQYIH